MKTCSGSADLRVVVVVLLLGIIVGFLGSLYVDTFRSTASESRSSGPLPSAPTTKEPFHSFAGLAEVVSPAVVNISTTKTLQTPRSFDQFYSPFRDFFGDELWNRFFDPQPRERKQTSLGSGFIISKEGYIVTNAHVVEGADEISIRLSNGKTYDATIVGVDKKTDLALVKTTSRGRLPEPVTLGDSDALRVGDWVVAIGNPFGLDHTVTAGIVSAKGRVIGAGAYDDFIQTDASINPGNSGGPLFNTSGQVVGINAAIFTTTGGNIGIGFAVPINMAKSIIEQLQDKGEVTRGWIGVAVQELTPELSESFGIRNEEGALVANVVPGSPADKAGIQAGDIIVAFQGQKIENVKDLPHTIGETPIGTTAEITIIRQGEKQKLPVTVQEMEESSHERQIAKAADLGLQVEELPPDTAQRWGYNRYSGLIVTRVEPGSLADDAGLQAGDLIVEVNRTPLGTLKEYHNLLEQSSTKRGILFLVMRDQSSFYILVKQE